MKNFIHTIQSDEIIRVRICIALAISIALLAVFYTWLVHGVISNSVILSNYQKQYSDNIIEFGNLKTHYIEIFTSQDFEDIVSSRFSHVQNAAFVQRQANIVQSSRVLLQP